MKKDELIAEANRRWKEGDVIIPLNFPYKYHWGQIIKDSNSNSYKFSSSFYYDKNEDTLCNYGRGLGLIYSKGVWAGDSIIESYQIY